MKNIEDSADIPATSLVLPEMFIKDLKTIEFDNYYIPSQIYASICDSKNNEYISNWACEKFPVQPPRSLSLDLTSLKNSNNQQQQQVNTIAHSTSPNNLSQSDFNKTIIINVSRRYSKLSFVSDVTDKTLFYEYNFLYGYAESVSVSKNGIFFVINFTFGLTKAFKVIFKNNVPTSAKFISEFSVGPKPKSVISGIDWICATASLSKLVLWEMITGTTHRVIEFDDPISDLTFYEVSGLIWIGVGEMIVFLGINGQKLGFVDIGEKVTALTQIKESEESLSAFCGTDNGNLYVVNYSLKTRVPEFKQIESNHNCSIKRVIPQNKSGKVISMDAAGVVSQWNTDGMLDPDRSSVFTSCAVCTNPTQSICQFCNKPICELCKTNHLKGPNCRHCIAFI
ncbi:Beige/BEACH domain containing protein [Histomonas meleagridis]|uniref:Beige/BEACH domain containing protein n=1 Tax=Histomonas meleagridis TaxID=135588 RepID=UPI0035599F72|nr:Beige/BEACH domain containing protein [Histomonas meleagridis]KAH0804405.1 Beige/BEACH domain containing protein [Histomonas meleagridis]